MVKKQYDYFFARGIVTQRELTPAREKMAYFPQGAEPLFNGTGIAPGVFLRVVDTAIISVPGVPSELRGIVSQSLKEFFDQVFGEGEVLSRRVGVRCGGESLVEPVLQRIVQKYPEIYTKSLASAIGENAELEIIMTISGIGEKKVLLEKALEELCDGITELGFPVNIKE